MNTEHYRFIDYETDGPVAIITIRRFTDARNAIDPPTGIELYKAFRNFEADENLHVAVLTGESGVFCSGFDLKYFARLQRGEVSWEKNPPHGYHSMGTTMAFVDKPTIAAVEGYAVAGGLEVACWCDMRVAASDAVFGVYCRRWGMPLGDGGSVRLPRIVGQAAALDLILTGRGVSGEDAQRMNLVQRLTEPGKALESAIELAKHIASFPQAALRCDRRSSLEQWSLPELDAVMNEHRLAMMVYNNEPIAMGPGAEQFESGEGRHGALKSGTKLKDL